MIKLFNVIDIRTGQFHSVAIVKERNAKYFIPVNTEVDDGLEQGV